MSQPENFRTLVVEFRDAHRYAQRPARPADGPLLAPGLVQPRSLSRERAQARLSMQGTSEHVTTVWRSRVLVIDDDLAFAQTIADGLLSRGFDALPLTPGAEAASRLEGDGVDVLLTSLRMRSLDGIDLLKLSKRRLPSRPVILMAEYGAIELAIAAMRQGAYHYLIKPFMLEELTLFLERAIEEERRRKGGVRSASTHAVPSVEELVGSSEVVRKLRDLIDRVADASASVVISGETGTGKGVVARNIHARGARSVAPFVTVNCAAGADGRLQSELFGDVHGASGATPSRQSGALGRADHGTLLLDEVTEMPLPLQAQLLHVLESNVFDIRLIAITRSNLSERVKAGAFREDLAYRLGVINVDLPPLRARCADIPELVACFMARSKRRHPESRVKRFSPRALTRLREYAWPGNVRELEHCVEQAVLIAPGPDIDVEHLPPAVVATPPAPATFHGEVVPLRELGRHYARWAYEQSDSRKIVAAERLQIDNKTLNKLLEDVGEGSQVSG